MLLIRKFDEDAVNKNLNFLVKSTFLTHPTMRKYETLQKTVFRS